MGHVAGDVAYGALGDSDAGAQYKHRIGNNGSGSPGNGATATSVHSAAVDRRTMLGLCLLELVFGTAFSLVAPFLPPQALRSGVPQWVVGVMFAAFPVTMLVAAPASARAVATYGPRRTIVMGMVVLTTGVGAMGVLQLLQHNAFIAAGVALRVVQGFGAALAETGAFHIVSHCFGDRMGAVMGWTETCFGVGTMIGPPVGGALFELGGFYLPTTAMSGVIFLLLPLVYMWLPGRDAGAEDEPGRAVTLWQLLASPAVSLLATVIAVCFGSLSFMEPVLAPHWKRVLGLTPTQVGLLLALSCFTYCACAPAAGWVSDRRGRFGTVVVGIALLSTSLLVLGPVSPSIPLTVPLQTAAMSVIGIGASLAMVPAMPGVLVEAQRVVDSLPTCSTAASVGAASALLSASLSVGQIVGPVLGAAIVDKYSFAAATVVYAALVAVCGVALVGAKLHLPASFLAADPPASATSSASGSDKLEGGLHAQGNATVTGTSGSGQGASDA